MIPIRDDIRSARRPYVTYFLIAACTAVWLVQFRTALQSEGAFVVQLQRYGMLPREIARGQRLWTLISSVFMHGSWFHYFGNMLYLWIFGDNVEDALRKAGYLFLYILAGIVGNLTQVLVAPHSNVPTIGASGAISGIMGTYFVLYPRARVLTIVPFFIFMRLLYVPAALLLGLWIVFQILHGCSPSAGTGGGIAYWAHISGFLFGIVVGLVVKPRVRRSWYEIR